MYIIFLCINVYKGLKCFFSLWIVETTKMPGKLRKGSKLQPWKKGEVEKGTDTGVYQFWWEWPLRWWKQWPSETKRLPCKEAAMGEVSPA